MQTTWRPPLEFTVMVTILCGLLWAGRSAASEYSRHYAAPMISMPIVIDGALDDQAWSGVAWTEPYVLYGTLDSATQTATRARMAWDATCLYVAVEAEDPDVWSTLTAHDGDLWNEDVVELFIDPEGDAYGYLEFEISPRNTVLDLWVEKPLFSQGGPAHMDWNAAGLRSAVRVHGTLGDDDLAAPERQDTDSGWTMELALPWEDAAVVAGAMSLPPAPGDTWRINLTRYDYRHGERELSQWSPSAVKGAWHEPAEYGYVTFVGHPTSVQASSWSAVKNDVR